MTVSVPSRNRALDGMRGVLALFVMFFHCMNLHAAPGVFENFLRQFISNVVPTFFALSGYLLLKIYNQRLQHVQHPKLTFYIGRFCRIMPLWFVLIIFIFVRRKLDVDVALANVFFMFGFLVYDIRFLPVVPAWSLFIEEVFYLVFPWVRRLFVWPSSAVLFVLLLILKTATLQYWSYFGLESFAGHVEWLPFANLHFFVLGAFLYRLIDGGGATGDGVDDLLNRPCLYGTTAVELTILLVIFGTAAGLHLPTELTVFLLSLCVFAKRGRLANLLSGKILGWVGVRCYGVYILHSDVVGEVIRLFSRSPWFTSLSREQTLYEALIFLGTLVTTLFLAGVSYSWLERPAIRFGKRIADRLNGK